MHGVLIHSPFTTAVAWGELPAALSNRGWRVTVTDVLDDEPPYNSRFVALTAQQLQLAAAADDVILIGHGAAGPLLPQIAFARQASGHPVHGYVFVDALLPRTLRAGTLLDIMAADDPVAAAELAQQLADGAAYPGWTDRDLVETIPHAGDRALLLASLRPRHLDFFTETLPLAEDWPDAPCSYVQLTKASGAAAQTARQRGWDVRSVVDAGAHHFWAMTNPDDLADVLCEVAPR